MLNTIMAIIMVVLFYGTIFGCFGYLFYELIITEIKERKEKNRIETKRARRDQLIKEMKAGTFNEEKADDMVNELDELIWECDKYIFKSYIKMEKKHSGIIQLKTLNVNGYSWI